MALNPQPPEERNDDGSESNTSSIAAFSALASGTAGEVMIIRTLQRFIGPILVPILRPLIRQLVREEVGLAKHELLTSMEEIPINKASTSVLKKLKPQFRNKVLQPVFTGMPLLGENKTPIEIALVDADTGQIVNIGIESTVKLEIVGCRVGDDEGDKDSWTFEDFQKRVLGEKKGKCILQGDTCVQLKEGIGFVGKISFTFNSTHTRNGLYKLGAIVADAAITNGVEVAWTETFLVKDQRATYSAKHLHPSLFAKVCHLKQISYKGNRYKRLKDAEVNTVKDLLTLLHTDPKRLKDTLGPVTSKIWNDIINHAQKSDGMFLYLDPSNEQKGVVLDVKLQLKGLILESHQYLLVEAQKLVNFAREHLEALHPFEDETSLIEHLQSGTGFSSLSSANQSLGTSKVIGRPPRSSSRATYSFPNLIGAPSNLDNSNLHMGQSTYQAPGVTSQSERGKEMVPLDDEMTYSTNYHQEHILLHPPDLESPNGTNFGAATERHAHNPIEPGTSSQVVESLPNKCRVMNALDILNQSLGDFLDFDCLLNYDPNIHLEILNNEWHSKAANSDADALMVAAQTVSVTIARTRWTKVSKLLRRNSVRERISLPEGIQALKKQRCC
ncbi:hypothetical protein L6452_07130 [Arctium lappa]|uniref:Uncharacterized protein n=1 Tax=Arctium lappa TaxID=4217 RepID=A0ACB9EJY0_ARCLA|nr:hypothetical protein L6452_07130 [Arctium lappa]